MNHIYKVVWSKTKHCYVVASEFAKASGKSAGKKAVVGAALAAIALTGTGAPVEASLADVKEGTGITVEGEKSGLFGANDTYTVSLSQDTQAKLASIDTKADQSTVDTLSTKVTTNTSNISALQTAVAEKADSATVSALSTKVDTNSSAISDLQTADQTLQSNINAETTKRIQGDSTLQGEIDKNSEKIGALSNGLKKDQEAIKTNEKNIATNAAAIESLKTTDSELSQAIASNKQEIDENAQAIEKLQSADQTIQSSIAEETAAREAADTSINSQITTIAGQQDVQDEKIAALNKGLEADQVEINANKAAIEAETKTREQADKDLSTAIDGVQNYAEWVGEKAVANESAIAKETKAREEGDTQTLTDAKAYADTKAVDLDKKINAEITNRAAEGVHLQTQITDNADAITDLQAADTALEDRVSTNEAAIGGLQQNVALLEEVDGQQQLEIYANKTAIATNADAIKVLQESEQYATAESNKELIAVETKAREDADVANLAEAKAYTNEQRDNEAKFRIAADENLQKNINFVYNQTLHNNGLIKGVDGRVTQEIADRIAGDEQTLTDAKDYADTQDDVVREEFAAADKTLQDNIDAETTARTDADEKINEKIQNISATENVTTVKGLLTTDNLTSGTIAADSVSAGNVTVSQDLEVVGDTTLTDAAVTGTLSVGKIANVETAITDNTTAITNETAARTAADTAIINDYKAADSQLSSKIDSVDSNSKKGIAGVAALAALHPLDFDPDAKWDFAAGYGNYRGENAAAIGAYYRPNEDIMFSVGGTLGNSDNNSVNAGLSLKIGAGSSHVNNSKTAMAKEIKDLRAIVEKQDAQIQKMAAMFNSLAGIDALTVDQSKLFPDVPENHWAYEAVDAMAKTGLIEGYPDGEFKGDRLLTRYEFAQVVYRAIQKGAEIDSRLVSEFEPELKYFHIDAVHKDKDGNATVERVRVNK